MAEADICEEPELDIPDDATLLQVGDAAQNFERCQTLRKLSHIRLYKKRWLMLFAVCLLNSSNAMLWISFAPVADLTAKYLKCSLDTINYLSLVYLVISIPFGFLASWLLDTLGMKYAIIISSWLNMTGSIVRTASSIPFMNPGKSNLVYLFVGQSICAVAQPLVLFVPAKLAAVWFPEHQRATANMIASMSNPFGIFLANILSPVIVSEAKDIPLLHCVYGIPAVVACIVATGGVTLKAPLTPPSVSAVNSTSEPFFAGLKQLMKNKAYIILMICFGSGLGIFTAFSAFLEQIMCFNGYSNFIAGLCGALFIVFGAIGALLCGLYVDRSKKFTETVKICFALTSLTVIAFAVVSNLKKVAPLLAVICSLLGFFGFAIYPIAMELAVECSYPVGEGSSTGLAFISGQIQGLIFMIIFQSLTKPFAVSPESSCGMNQIEIYDWSTATLVMAGICSIGACIFIIFFHTDYKRLKAEEAVERRKEEDELILP
ncbi:solute carrier family 49 member A3 [Hyla sarda]|uniref:solute carrier family 49 member A3 n=1 Tax=Hyla sarda TaxID=327740 RepID=UPI0024C36B30|nr:solute carrier family 49 member A3 [Hyla sarda]XP_056374235.1 solute carrier family 49 member A3 [Hyla sarda]XP_056374236.1 solute carrier family 49 member A3 [Hyla sarda]